MKKIIFITIAILLFSMISFGQTDSTQVDLGNEMTKMLNTKISMEVDSQLYKNSQGNFYISEKPQAMIMAMVIPQSYEKAKEKLSEDVKKKNVVIKNAGEFEVNGKKIGFKTGEMKENGENMIIELYVVEATKENTIFITGVYLPTDKLRFANSAKKAASTAKLE
jgi:hypothetical protein